MEGTKILNKKMSLECDMLQGNINRMFVTQNKDELVSMYCYAKSRLQLIYEFNLGRL